MLLSMRAEIRNLTIASLLAALTAVLSMVAIPLPGSPVPLTGQTLGVMLAGALLGPWWGSASMLAYLGIGFLGFPVFSGGKAGFATLAGPTGGYLLGFVLGAWATGALSRYMRGRYYALACTVGGVVVVHVLGTVWLASQTGRTWQEAFFLGSAPFLAGDMVKVVLASFLCSRLRPTGPRSSR
ncbi:MAG: biotin transporter BioY [Bacillota bacterium]